MHNDKLRVKNVFYSFQAYETALYG